MTICITVELALWLAKADFAPVRSIGIKPVFVSMHPHPVFSHNPRLTAHRARGRRIKPIYQTLRTFRLIIMPERSRFVLVNRREQMRVDAPKRDPAAV